MLPATRGEVALLGRRIDALPSREIARLGVARTFQHVKMIGAMTVLENVALGAHLRGRHGVPAAMLRTDRAEERRLMKEAERQLQRIGMGELMHEQAGNLALGQQRLMEIARALAADPTLLLLDEPAAGLRLKEKEGLATVLRQLRDEGLSILLVEHDMDLVMGLVDRVVVMEFGTKLIEGTPEEVQASPGGARRLPRHRALIAMNRYFLLAAPRPVPPGHGGSLSFAGPNESNQSKGPNTIQMIASARAFGRQRAVRPAIRTKANASILVWPRSSSCTRLTTAS